MNGTNTGLYIGASYGELLQSKQKNLPNFDSVYQHFVGYVTHAFNLKGPSMEMDTACASSLTALNEAVLAMKKGICDRALVVGVSITLQPVEHMMVSILLIIQPFLY